MLVLTHECHVGTHHTWRCEVYHLLVRTLSGAFYTFRVFHESGNVYVTTQGSSTGSDLTNLRVCPCSLDIRVGERAGLRSLADDRLFRVTSTVVYWELTPIMGGLTTTSHDFETEQPRVALATNPFFPNGLV
jgi:hypothetical protein